MSRNIDVKVMRNADVPRNPASIVTGSTYNTHDCHDHASIFIRYYKFDTGQVLTEIPNELVVLLTNTWMSTVATLTLRLIIVGVVISWSIIALPSFWSSFIIIPGVIPHGSRTKVTEPT